MADLTLTLAAPRRGKPPRHWADLATADRDGAVRELGLPAYRADQISRHYFEGLSVDPASWTDLPADRRELVRDTFFPPLLTRLTQREADGGATAKTLWRLHDGTLVESVLMRYGVRRTDGTNVGGPGDAGVRSTLCVSSQAGCGMACPFCATGK